LVWTTPDESKLFDSVQFQSLGRDSVGLDPARMVHIGQPHTGFNPSVGILLVWTRDDVLAPRDDVAVSIPRSGFCWFGLEIGLQQSGPGVLFQSLGRDSVGLDSGQ